MPYKLSGKRVMVYKSGKWHVAPGGTHKTRAAAMKHLAALKMHVKK